MLLNFKETSRKVNISLNILVILFVISVAETIALCILNDVYEHSTLTNVFYNISCGCVLFTGIYLICWKNKTELVCKKDSKRLRKILEWVSKSEGYYFTVFAAVMVITLIISLIFHINILDIPIVGYIFFGLCITWVAAIILSSLCVNTEDFVKEENQDGFENI